MYFFVAHTNQNAISSVLSSMLYSETILISSQHPYDPWVCCTIDIIRLVDHDVIVGRLQRHHRRLGEGFPQHLVPAVSIRHSRCGS